MMNLFRMPDPWGDDVLLSSEGAGQDANASNQPFTHHATDVPACRIQGSAAGADAHSLLASLSTQINHGAGSRKNGLAHLKPEGNVRR